MLKIAVRFLVRLFYGANVSGSIRPAPRMLVIGNHESFLDAVLYYALLPVDLTWLVHSSIARLWYFKLALRAVDHLVLDTTSPLAVKAAIGLIEAGKPVIIFPEGRITVTGTLMKIYEGPALMAARTGAEVVPIHIKGAVYARFFTRMKGDFPQRLFPRISLTIFPPVTIPMPDAPNAKERRRLAGEAMRGILQRMIVETRRQTTVFDEFLHAIALHGRGREMIEDATGAFFTYGKLLKAALALGRLVSKHTAEKEAVGVLMPTVGATYALLLGLFCFRRVPAMLNYTAGAQGVQSALRAARVRTIIVSRAFVERAKLQPMVAKLEGVKVLYLEDLRAELSLADKLWLLFYALPFPRAVMRKAEPSEPAIVIYTSGSEGVPKGVVLSHANLLANVAQIRATIDFSSKDKFMGMMPLFHSFGIIGGFLAPLFTGSPIYVYPSPLHYRIVPEMIYDRDCTIVFATNTFLANYAKRAHPYDFRSARLVVAGAEKLTDEVRRVYFEKFGVRIVEAYGATECSPGIAANSPMAMRFGTVGKLVPCLEAKLEPVPGIAEGGLLHLKGPNVMMGYWKEDRPGELQFPPSVFGPGWYNTGDIVTIDADGFLTLKGRARRFAKVAGEMVSLEVVEKIAEAASPAALHAVIARPDPGRGESLVLYTQDAGLKRDQLMQAARSLGAPEIAVPRRIEYIDNIPLLGNGKKDYPALERRSA